MKKITTFILLIAMFLPIQNVLAFETLFYYFENENGYSEYKKQNDHIDIIAPQVYVVDYDLKVDGPTTRKLLKLAKKEERQVMPLLVNKDFDKVLMSDILINLSAQNQIIDFLIKEAKKENYIGWQYDFENINHLDRNLYTEFVKRTHERLKAEGLVFSVAVIVRNKDYNPNDKAQDWSSAYDYKELAKYSDFISLMTYDDPNSYGPVASKSYVQDILNYLTKIVPAENMSLGVPAYCWKWSENPRKRVGATTYKLAEKAYKKGKNRDKGFDTFFGAEWFRYEKDGVKYEIWCDNSDSFELKKTISELYGLRGISVWALGQGDKGIWKILD